MTKQPVIFRDLGQMNYKAAWDYQERLLSRQFTHSPLTTYHS